MDRENCGWDRHVRQTVLVFVMAQQFLVGHGLFTEASRSHTTLGRTHLDEGSACCRGLYLTTHNTHKRQTSMPRTGFELATPASEWPHPHAFYRVATWIGSLTSI